VSYVHRKNTSLTNSAKLSWRAQTVSADVETRRNESGPDALPGGRNRFITTLQRCSYSCEEKSASSSYFQTSAVCVK